MNRVMLTNWIRERLLKETLDGMVGSNIGAEAPGMRELRRV